jgi:phosphoribosyl-dephospho-CoA transferase
MFARHDLAWLSQQGWQRALAAAPANDRDAIGRWRHAGWPAVVRRDDADQAPGQLSLGIALPPSPADGTKTRVGLRVLAADVDRVAPPLPVAQVIAAAPASWQPLLAALERHAAAQGLAVRVYGSLALQALTGQTYLTAASDIDVLLHPVTRSQLADALDVLSTHAGGLPLDGEIVFPSAQAVAWKELSSALARPTATRVLVKEMHGVSLATTSALLAALQDDLCIS